MVYLAKKLKHELLPLVKKIPKMNNWVFINQNDYFSAESDDENNADDEDDSGGGMTNEDFVKLIDALVLYQVEDQNNNNGTIG